MKCKFPSLRVPPVCPRGGQRPGGFSYTHGFQADRSSGTSNIRTGVSG